MELSDELGSGTSRSLLKLISRLAGAELTSIAHKGEIGVYARYPAPSSAIHLNH